MTFRCCAIPGVMVMQIFGMRERESNKRKGEVDKGKERPVYVC